MEDETPTRKALVHEARAEVERPEVISADTSPPYRRDVVGDSVGPYRLEQELGEGGMGIVWKARQTEPDRCVALKIIKPGLGASDLQARFRIEMQAQAWMTHPNVATLFAADISTDGRPYFVMEFVDGSQIHDYCRDSKLPVQKRIELFTQVCDGVQQAHQNGVIHRDLTRRNVLVTSVGGHPQAKVIDFGIAKFTKRRPSYNTDITNAKAIGTLEYMSPEQVDAVPDIDTRTDIYALGTLLYELLTGSTPLTLSGAQSLTAILKSIKEFTPPHPSTRLVGSARHVNRNEIDCIVMKCLGKARDIRYRAAGDLADDLRRYLKGDPILARRPTIPYLARKAIARWRIPIAFGCTVICAFVVALVLWLQQRHHVGLAEQALAYRLFDQGTRYCERGDIRTGLVYLANSLERAMRQGLEHVEIAARNNVALWERSLSAPRYDIRHSIATEVAVFSNAGDKLLLGSDNGDAIVLRTEDAVAQMTLAHTAPVVAGAFASGDRVLVTATLRSVHRWDCSTGAMLSTLSLDDGVTNVWLAPDGVTMLSANADQSGQLWNLVTSKPVGAPLSHDRWAISVAQFSADSSIVATGSGDRSARIWDTKSGKMIGIPFVHRAGVTAIAISADGRIMLVGTGSGVFDSTGEGRLWDLHRCEPIGPWLVHDGRVSSVALSANAAVAATGSYDKTVKLWDTSTGAALGAPLRHTFGVRQVAFSGEGTRLLSAENSKNARLWDLALQTQLGPTISLPSIVRCCAFGRKDAVIVVAGTATGPSGSAECTVALRDVTLFQGSVPELLLRTELLARRSVDARGAVYDLDDAAIKSHERRLSLIATNGCKTK